MKNGFHDHYCPKCKHGFVCPKVTHCNDPFETLCLDHRWEGLAEAWADERYLETGKRPGESE